MSDILRSWLAGLPLPDGYSDIIVVAVLLMLVATSAVIAYWIIKHALMRAISAVILNSKTKLDDVLVERKFFGRVAYLVPGGVFYWAAREGFSEWPTFASSLLNVASVAFVGAVVLVIDSIIDSMLDMYQAITKTRQLPVQNVAQVTRLFVYFVAVILIISILIDQSPFKLFAGLGAMTAILMLVFKDPILGFVAGIQLSYNKMVQVGDWVDIPQHNASGDILDIGLTTVKVKNFDNTITTLPTQSLINDSFKNWRGMQDSAGRRIKRAVYIDINSIKICNAEAIARLKKIEIIRDYIESRSTEIDKLNKLTPGTDQSIVNGRRLTNIGVFRAYIEAYLVKHPNINQQLTLLVRQLPSTSTGLPIEIYAFSTEKNWVAYETIQADIFDHVLAMANEFDLRIFQQPSGMDVQSFIRT